MKPGGAFCRNCCCCRMAALYPLQAAPSLIYKSLRQKTPKYARTDPSPVYMLVLLLLLLLLSPPCKGRPHWLTNP